MKDREAAVFGNVFIFTDQIKSSLFTQSGGWDKDIGVLIPVVPE